VYVCICNGVTESQIREAAANGVRNVAELTMRTGCGASCGSCLDTAVEVLQSVHADGERQSLLPILGLSHAA
jgi:bacterioferritin-associated ferredoxin